MRQTVKDRSIGRETDSQRLIYRHMVRLSETDLEAH